MKRNRIPDDRTDRWFSTRTRSEWHVKAADGDYATCNKAISPRRAPREDTGEWGVWYATEAWLGQWEHIRRCPKCLEAVA